MDKNATKIKPNGFALIPFAIFVVVYLAVGIILVAKGDNMGFYKLKAPIAVIIGIIFAFIMHKGTIESKFETLVSGCGDSNIIIMCIIYILAGAFSVISAATGAVDSVVNFGLMFIPPAFITAGIFLICCFLSLATGTSTGTIAAVAPVAIGLASGANISMPLAIGAMVGGAMFGDNLSVISDTTIAATRTQGVKMRDKFRVNMALALPAAFITFVILLIFARPDTPPTIVHQAFDGVKILPYLFVLIAAIAGMNVFVVLTLGTIFSGIVGLFYNSFTVLQMQEHIYNGFNGMFEIFLLSMLTGGLAAMVTKAGGMAWLISKISKLVKGKRSAEVGIISLTMLTNTATANNTVAIIIDGPVVREMSEVYKVDPRRSASLLDAASCVMQGMIPYGAQLLIACSFTSKLARPISPTEVIPFLWYQGVLLLFLVLSIFVPWFNGYIRRHPFNFEHWCDESEVKKQEDQAISA